MALAMSTGIAPQSWREADERDLETALVMMHEQNEEIKRARKGK